MGGGTMLKQIKYCLAAVPAAIGLMASGAGPAAAAIHIDELVGAGGVPVAQSTVTLWAASAAAPALLGQAKTGVTSALRFRMKRAALARPDPRGT